MTIQEITELRNEEMQGRLRMPKSALNVENIQQLREVNDAVNFLSRADKRSFLLLVKMFIKGFNGVNDLKGIGIKNCPYEIDTVFGKGEFYFVGECFKDGKLPNEIEYRQCFHNCYLVASRKYIENCEILSGIAYRGGEDGKPFLHSVIKKGNKILDFNYNLCMDENLYFSLFNFEILNVVKSETVVAEYPVIKKFRKYLNNKGATSIHAVFAWDDLIDFIYDKNRRKNETIEILN